MTALALALGIDQGLTTAVPGYTEALQNRIERSSVAQRELAKLRRTGDQAALAADGTAPVAPELQGIVEWINSEPLTLSELRGRVVLIDFWTYSCVNCLRTLPHLEAWDSSYRADGLTVVGVHAPEFAFERVPDNVRAAVRKLGVRYPVALDNDFVTWTEYANQYWPAKYLIDRTGRVRYVHYGEGKYDETERQIRRYLGSKVPDRGTAVADRTPTVRTTPESYLGYERLARFVGSRVVAGKESTYRFPLSLPPDHLAYAGRLRVEGERIVTGAGAGLRLRFLAREVNLVLGGRGTVQVLLDGRRRSTVAIRGEPRLYNLLRRPRLAEGVLELRFTPGLSAYAFTFG
ncbi:MAG TPA: thioredoxin family protein [Gaiellaceae bacterium]|nr:thioredoxin family protein [Gaiellaceae bacterium]